MVEKVSLKMTAESSRRGRCRRDVVVHCRHKQSTKAESGWHE